MKKLELKKKVISVLTNSEQRSINGGKAAAGTTSYTNCSGFLCCSPEPCVSASLGSGASCLMTPGCRPQDPPTIG